MATIDLNLLRSFSVVHETGSFSLAARKLGVPRSTVSRAVGALEKQLGLRLFQRTTRSVSTTTAGLALYGRTAGSLNSLDQALADLPQEEKEPSGVLRVTTTPDLGVVLLAEVAARFTERYPRTRIEVHLTADVVDLVKDRFDFALRVAIRRPKDSSLVTQRLGSFVLQFYASPGYVARRGLPKTKAELAEHPRVGFASKWPTMSPVGLTPSIACDDMFFAREALRAGGGIGALPSFLGDVDVASGALVRVLPKFVLVDGTVSLVQPSREHVSSKTRAFRELLTDSLRRRTFA